MTVRGVLFDLGNTLIKYYQPGDFQPILKKSIGNCCRLLTGYGYDFNLDEVFDKAVEMNRERADLTVYPLADRLKAIFTRQADLSREHLDQLIKVFMEPIFEVARADDSAVPMLQALRNKSIKTGVISNTPWGSPSELWHAELNRHNLSDNVDLALFCVDVGWRKPSPVIFEKALALLDLEPRHTLFVGDDIRWDINGARDAGLKAVLLNRGKQTPAPPVDSIDDLSEVLSLIEQ